MAEGWIEAESAGDALVLRAARAFERVQPVLRPRLSIQ